MSERPFVLVRLLAAGALCACTSFAVAVPLAPGAFVFPLPGSSAAAEPQLGGVVVEDVLRTVSGNFSQTGLPFEAQIQDRVIHSVDGTFDFYFQVTLTTKPDVYPMVVSREGFAGFATNVGWRTDQGGTQPPDDASRTADADTIVFSWGFGDVPQGSVTRFFYVDTDATAYAETGAATVNLSPSFNENGSATFVTFAPAAVAVPATGLLLAGGLGVLGWARRRNGAAGEPR